MTEPPHEWADLRAHQRDILISLDIDGPDSGRSIWKRLGQHVSHPTTHNHLEALEELGLIAAEPKNGRENIYSLTDKSQRLLEEVREWMNAE